MRLWEWCLIAVLALSGAAVQALWQIKLHPDSYYWVEFGWALLPVAIFCLAIFGPIYFIRWRHSANAKRN